jgi:hypothetical protein
MRVARAPTGDQLSQSPESSCRNNWNAALETGGFLLSKSVRLEIETELIKK